MDVFSPFQQVPASQVQPGSIVVLNWGRIERTIALVVTGPGLSHPSFLLLHPGHPMLDQPGLLSPGTMVDVPVFAVPGALAVIKAEPNDIAHAQRGDHAPAGSLFITPAGRYATMGYVDRNDLRTFMLDNGEMLPPDWQRAWFPRWSIVAPVPNGKTQTLCEISIPDPQPRD